MSKSIDWSDVKYGFNPLPARKSFYVIRSKPGCGKTTFVCGIPDALHLDADPLGGGSTVVGARAGHVSVRSYDDLMRVHKKLLDDSKENGDDRKYWNVIWDPAGQILTFCREHMCKKLGVDEIEGFAHGNVASHMRMLWLQLTNAGYGMTITDHLLDVKMNEGNKERIVTEALLPASVIKFLEQDCHHILTFALEPVTERLKDPKTGKDGNLVQTLRYTVTTKPGRKTSLANPKARVWLPSVFTDWPQTGVASELWDAFEKQHAIAVEKMASLDNEVKGK